MHERRRWNALAAGLTVACLPLLLGSCSTSKYVANEPAEGAPAAAAAESPDADAPAGTAAEQAPAPLPGTGEYSAQRIRDIESGLNPLNSIPAAKTSSAASGDAKSSALVTEKNGKK